MLPAHVVNEFCHQGRPFHPVPDFGTGGLTRERSSSFVYEERKRRRRQPPLITTRTVVTEWYSPSANDPCVKAGSRTMSRSFLSNGGALSCDATALRALTLKRQEQRALLKSFLLERII